MESVVARGRVAVGALWVAGLLASTLACGGGGGGSPWLFCTTNPCQPLALSVVPTPPPLVGDASMAAPCDYSGPGAADGVLRWHTDWDPKTREGECVSREEAGLE